MGAVAPVDDRPWVHVDLGGDPSDAAAALLEGAEVCLRIGQPHGADEREFRQSEVEGHRALSPFRVLGVV
jgi:hypothetical protein